MKSKKHTSTYKMNKDKPNIVRLGEFSRANTTPIWFKHFKRSYSLSSNNSFNKYFTLQKRANEWNENTIHSDIIYNIIEKQLE